MTPLYGSKTDACAVKGCGTVLRSDNPLGVCGVHERMYKENGIPWPSRERRKNGTGPVEAEHAAPPENVPTPARGQRNAPKAAKGVTLSAILAYLEDAGAEWSTSTVIAAALGLHPQTITTHMQPFVHDGRVESRNAGKGGGYRLVRTSAGCDTALDLASQSQSEPEKCDPATVNEVSTSPEIDTSPVPSPELRPFAGIPPVDPELCCIEHCMTAIEAMPAAARARVAAYVASRYL